MQRSLGRVDCHHPACIAGGVQPVMLWYFKLAFSVFFVTTSLLLVGLRVRSNWRADRVSYTYGKGHIGIESRNRRVLPWFQKNPRFVNKWRFDSQRIDASVPVPANGPFSCAMHFHSISRLQFPIGF